MFTFKKFEIPYTMWIYVCTFWVLVCHYWASCKWQDLQPAFKRWLVHISGGTSMLT